MPLEGSDSSSTLNHSISRPPSLPRPVGDGDTAPRISAIGSDALAEQIIADHCGNPLTTYVGKPVPQNRNEAVFRIYLTEKTRERLSPKARETIEDFAWMLLNKYNRNITRAEWDELNKILASGQNRAVAIKQLPRALAVQRKGVQDGEVADLQLFGEGPESRHRGRGIARGAAQPHPLPLSWHELEPGRVPARDPLSLGLPACR